jgi:hypothetical protein
VQNATRYLKPHTGRFISRFTMKTGLFFRSEPKLIAKKSSNGAGVLVTLARTIAPSHESTKKRASGLGLAWQQSSLAPELPAKP